MLDIKGIRLYKPGDEHGIVKLFKEIFGREMTLDEWRWKYTGRENKKVYASVAVTDSQEITAHYGGIPHRMVYGGREIYGLAIGDVMVHPKFRGLKLFKKIAAMVPEEAVRDGFIVGYGFPNERAMRLPEKLGLYEKVEDVIEGSKEAKFHNNLVRYNFKLFPLDYSDIRIDKLWESCKRSLYLAVVRDRRYLTWRYKNHPLFSYEIWGLKKRFGRRLQGLVILKREEHRVLVMDFLFAKGMFKPLFQKLENYASSAGIKTITLWAPPFMENTLIENSFSTKPAITSIPRTTHEKTLTKEQIKGKFFYTMGDTDLQ